MDNFDDYSMRDQQQPGFFRTQFGSPLKVMKTFNQVNLYKTVLSGSMWKSAAKGTGIRWGGIVGFRGIAAGESAASSAFARTLSPSRLVGSIWGKFSKEGAEKFTKFGLFGSEGVLNAANNKSHSALARFFGGGVIGRSKFLIKDVELESHVSEMYNLSSSFSKSAKNVAKFNKLRESAIARHIKINSLGVKPGTDFLFTSSGQAEIVGKVGLKEAAEKFIGSNLAKRATVMRIVRLGRLANWAFAADMAFDIASFLGTTAINTIGGAANAIEDKLSGLMPNRRGFASKVGAGFYAGRSGTERQRALSAIGRGYGGDAGMGNEAAYQHIDSSW